MSGGLGLLFSRRGIMMHSAEGHPQQTADTLYIENISNGGTRVKFSKNSIEYSFDKVEWTALPANTYTPNVAPGIKVYLRAKGLTATDNSGIGTFSVSNSAYFNVGGNVMSMMYGEEFEEMGEVIPTDYAFSNLFYNCRYLKSAARLMLPATTLTTYCYSSMFCYCTSLEDAPELPATTLATYCYSSMFYDCTSLEVAPELPATTLESYCYYTMFRNCASLEVAPVLPATTLTTYCYRTMFYDCKKLRYVKALFTSSPSSDYTGSWLTNVAPIGTFVKNASATWDVVGANGVPEGWTIETAES